MSSLLNWDLRKRRSQTQRQWTVSWSGHRWQLPTGPPYMKGKRWSSTELGTLPLPLGHLRRGMVRSTLHTVVTVVYVGPTGGQFSPSEVLRIPVKTYELNTPIILNPNQPCSKGNSHTKQTGAKSGGKVQKTMRDFLDHEEYLQASSLFRHTRLPNIVAYSLDFVVCPIPPATAAGHIPIWVVRTRLHNFSW